ncbi:MAG: hypothetical protein AAGH90_11580, partial [Pseudomonadota bacterium]
MKGLGKMVAILATSVATLACQGCVSITPAPASAPAPQVYDISPSDAAYPTTASPSFALTSSTVWTQTDREQAIERLPETLSFLAPVEPVMTIGPAPISGEALTSFAAERVQEQLIEVPRNQRAFNGEIALSAPAGNLEVGIAPRFSIRQEGAFSTRRVGGEVRIGQNFDKRGQGRATSSWYLFAGA